jgi:hypothetical protein
MAEDDKITISRLEVRFDVEGDEQEMAFARLFQKYIEQWARAQEEQQHRQRRAAAERALGDREGPT